MYKYEWDEIIETMWGWNAPSDARARKAIYIACANYLSSNDITSTWEKCLDWYGRFIISPGPDIWATEEGQLSIVIHALNSPYDSEFLEAVLLEYRNSEVKTVRITLDNCYSELETLIQYICRNMNLEKERY